MSEAVAFRLRQARRNFLALDKIHRAQRLLLYWWMRGIEFEARRALRARLFDEDAARD